jgi:hypothetical protein
LFYFLYIVTGNGSGFLVMEVLIMDNTAAERQAAFRKRMKDRGFRLMQIWVDAEGFPGKSKAGRQSPRPEYSLDQLLDVLAHVTVGADESFQAKLYGELAVYARGIREAWDLSRQSQELFTVEDESNKHKKDQLTLF